MAKGSQFWGNASGKLGQQVLYRAGGEQRARMYVNKIRNPRTKAQAVNRLSMLNLSTAFREMADFLRVSFVGRPTNQSGFNAFVKANKTPTSPVIGKYAAGLGLFIPVGMVVSQGNLRLPFNLGYDMIDGWNGIWYGKKWGISEATALLQTDEVKVIVGENFNPATSEDKEFVIDTKEKVQAAFKLLGLPSDAVVNCLAAEYRDEGYAVTRVKITPDNPSTHDVHQFVFVYTQDGGAILGFNSGYDSDSSDEVYMAFAVSYKNEGKIDITTTSFESISGSNDIAKDWQPDGYVYDQIVNDYVQTSANAIEG